MEIIIRSDATKLGLPHYYTGKPCKHGHLSKRRVKDRVCMDCDLQKKNEKKMYKMTYLRPYTFMTDHCEDIDCMDNKFCLAFSRITSTVLLTDRQVERIKEENVYRGTKESLEAFIDVDVLRSFPEDNESLGSEIEWYEFPVISVEENIDKEHDETVPTPGTEQDDSGE